MRLLSADQTAAVLPYKSLVEELAEAVRAYESGGIICPPRLVLKQAGPEEASSGTLLCMPALAPDLMVTKLLTVFPQNHALPSIQGQLTVCDATDGRFLFALDGPTVTARRTAALSMLALSQLARSSVKTLLLIGTGAQARGHLEALRELFPQTRVFLRGRRAATVAALCAEARAMGQDVTPESASGNASGPNGLQEVDAVVTVTGSRTPVYGSGATARPVSPLAIAVGAYRPEMAEIAPDFVHASTLYVDDPVGAPEEAGDFIQANVDWADVTSFARLLSETRTQTQANSQEKPVLFKSVGCAAWDMAAARLARRSL